LTAFILTSACTAGITFGQNGPTREKPAPKRSAADPALEQAKSQKLRGILGEWEKQSTGLSSLNVRFTRQDFSPGWDDANGPTEYRGQAVVQSPDRAIVRFEKR
jgi:hypothetical protein